MTHKKLMECARHLSVDGFETFIELLESPWISHVSKEIFICDLLGFFINEAEKEYRVLKWMVDQIEDNKQRHEQEQRFISRGIPRYLWEEERKKEAAHKAREAAGEENSPTSGFSYHRRAKQRSKRLRFDYPKNH